MERGRTASYQTRPSYELSNPAELRERDQNVALMSRYRCVGEPNAM
uniref:Uncharacterized protein n=1 Tax=mine drainage metagenome TaxID=410659 RepID=E6Q191_9ZZZZ